MYLGNNVGHPLYPRTAGQTLTYTMSIRSASLEPKSQLTINLSLERKQRKESSQPKDRKKAKREHSQSKEGEKAKKERKFLIKHRKRRNMNKGLWTRQYLNNTELSPSKQEKKGNHDLKWSSPFDCQPKSYALVACSPHTKQKQKRKRPRILKTKFPKETNHSQEKVLLIHDHACNL